MIPIFEFFVMILATQRLTGLWFEEIGRPLRERVAKSRFAKFRYLAGCPLCISVWAGFAITGLWFHPYGVFVITGLALSSGVNLAELLAKVAMRESPSAMAIHQISRELNTLNGQMRNITVEQTN